MQRHRGPDGEGIWQSKSGLVGFAHRRLSIIDLDHGAQPMQGQSGNVIAYNGEIYNFIELRRELGEQEFQTTSDTEVILRAYEKWGEHCVGRFRGMFAFALWDAARQELFIARDRFGIKPFYYLVRKDCFYFASEIKALLPFVENAHVNLEALHDYFCFQFCLAGKTLFEGIKQLQPAQCGYVDRKIGLRLRRYWEVHYQLDWDHTEQ
ncbi:MAG TPA: hypothetical protein VFH31_08930, partial [Pyrinomonadaceae bacterium]|nr:hypothetical protein [Pyrinomonadaceae bacterium]